MASKYTPETNAMPHLVVKIVASRQVKYFVEEPDKSKVLNPEVVAADVPSVVPEDVSVHTGKISPSQSPFLNKALDESAHIHKELQQIRERQCVTAPCGDRFQSYIHLRKSLSALTNLRRAPSQRQSLLGEQGEGEMKDGEPDEERRLVLQAVREELRDWCASSSPSSSSSSPSSPSALGNMERDMLELDTSRTGAIHQAQLTYVFLRSKVPLKLPTLGRLFHVFSKETCPDEVLMQKKVLLCAVTSRTHFMRHSAQIGSLTNVSLMF
ncbi:uncharacterized protein C1orf87 homolog [Sardina pilchardus]|uniref:uncharacterized protein C1orf87 homolog n=1 Tax=Sardina pilchardus TaxID=27697 RepID=UPI002E108F2C